MRFPIHLFLTLLPSYLRGQLPQAYCTGITTKIITSQTA